MFAYLIFTFPFAIVIAIISKILAFFFILFFWLPIFIIYLASAVSEITQKKVTFTNKRIIKEIGLGRSVSIWYEHVQRFDKVSFPDGTGILYYTLSKKAFGRDLQIKYKVENIKEVNDAFSLVNVNA